MMGEAVRTDPSRSDFLTAVPVFAGLPESIRDYIAEHSRWLQVPAGAWLFRQGDPGDSLFIVRSGRLEIVVEKPERMVARVLGRGSAVGELALLTGSPRSASVRARRDSELLVVDRSSFSELLRTEPEFALALTRELGHQLQESRALAPVQSPLPSIVTFVPLGPGVDIERVCEGVSGAIGRWHSVAVLDGREGRIDQSEQGAVMDRTERDHNQVLLVAGEPGAADDWTEFCLRQSDRVIGVVPSGGSAPGMTVHPELRGCDLLFEGDQRFGVSELVETLEARATQFTSTDGHFDRALERLARSLAGRSVGVVLSGGGARGFAHLGVLAELVESGLVIDRIAGCSMGSYIAAMFAMGMDCDEMRERCRQEFVINSPLADYTVPIVSLLRGQRARAMVERTFGEERRIEELPLDYFCVSADLVSGDLVVHRRGLVYEAVGASMSLPGIFAPVARKKGYLLVDGGVLNNLPVEPMTASAEGPVIAVDVTARFLPPGEGQRRRGRPRIRQWTERSRRALIGWEEPLPRLNETLTRSIGIGGVEANERARRQRRPADRARDGRDRPARLEAARPHGGGGAPRRGGIARVRPRARGGVSGVTGGRGAPSPWVRGLQRGRHRRDPPMARARDHRARPRERTGARDASRTPGHEGAFRVDDGGLRPLHARAPGVRGGRRPHDRRAAPARPRPWERRRDRVEGGARLADAGRAPERATHLSRQGAGARGATAGNAGRVGKYRAQWSSWPRMVWSPRAIRLAMVPCGIPSASEMR